MLLVSMCLQALVQFLSQSRVKILGEREETAQDDVPQVLVVIVHVERQAGEHNSDSLGLTHDVHLSDAWLLPQFGHSVKV